jgi:uncharacterized protein (TIGR03435 family)
MIPAALANHLWQSTLFAAVCAAAALALRKNRAAVRHGVWLAASVKFLIPVSLLVSAAAQLGWRTTNVDTAAHVPAAVAQASLPFADELRAPVFNAPRQSISMVLRLAAGAWLGGCLVLFAVWGVKWRRIRAILRAATPLSLDAAIPARLSSTVLEPGVFGVFRPVLLLPRGITERLPAEQLSAVIAHEVCHVRRRDNLAAAVHMVVEAIFWFHPLVWWMGARLVDERERACDEEVLRAGNQPEAYAEGILNVCKWYLRSPLACASGVSGSDLKARIEAIMMPKGTVEMSAARKILLAAAGAAAVIAPVAIGILHAQESNLVFEVASIKASSPDAQGGVFHFQPAGGLSTSNGTVQQLIAFAYDIQAFQISGAPSWITSARYDILAKPAHPDGPTDMQHLSDEQIRVMQDHLRTRVRALLADRFHLVLHRDTKEFPVYLLVTAKGGSKLRETQSDQNPNVRAMRGRMEATAASVEILRRSLSVVLGRTVLDRTGLNGRYDFKMEWTPDAAPSAAGEPNAAIPADPEGPSIFSALQEQLGLKLEGGKGPVEIIVIDRLERPTEN